MTRFFCAAAAALLALALPASAAFAGAATEAATIRLPFDPPLGTPIRYRLTIHSPGGSPSVPASSIYLYRFERSGEGYRLTVTPENPDFGDFGKLAMSESARERLASFVRTPLILALSADAEITGITNETEYAGAFKAWFDSLIADMEASTDEQAKKIGMPIIQMLRNLPPEAWMARLVEDVRPVVEFAGTELNVGQEINPDLTGEGPGGGKLERTTTITLKGVSAGTAEITLRSVTNPDQLTTAFRPMIAQIEAAAKTEGAPVEFGEFVGLTQQAEATYRLATAHGLLESFRSEEVIEIEGTKGKERKVKAKTIDRLR